MTLAGLVAHRKNLRARLAGTFLQRERVDALNELAWLERDHEVRECERLCLEAYTLATSSKFSLHPYTHGLATTNRALYHAKRSGRNHTVVINFVASARAAYESIRAVTAAFRLHCARVLQ